MEIQALGVDVMTVEIFRARQQRPLFEILRFGVDAEL
jgi:hypothetical protein